MHTRENVEVDISKILERIKIAENYYQTLPMLKFQSFKTKQMIVLKKSHTAETFVKKFFLEFNAKYLTIDIDNNLLCTDIDCRRSLGDLYRLSLSYGLKISLKDIMIQTYKLIEKSEICGNYCYQINKRVYKERGSKNGSYYDQNQYDEFGFIKEHYQLLVNS